MSWLSKLLPRRPASPDDVRNEGLGLAMDWGEQWLSPVQGRLREHHPSLTGVELDGIDDDCRGAMRLGHETVHGFGRDGRPALLPESLAPLLRAKYLWISDENVLRLFQQSLYYATKAGGPARDR